MGITNALAQKAIISGLTRGITDDQAKFGDVARASALAIAPDVIQSGLGSLGQYLNPITTEGIKGSIEAAKIGANAMPIVQQTLSQQLGQLATEAANSNVLRGFVNPGTLMETAKAVAVPSGVEYGVNAVDAAKKAQEEYQRELQAMGNLAGANKEDQMNYIRRAMVSAGFNEDEISSAISRSGFVYGGRVGYGLGSLVKPAMRGLKGMKNKIVDFISKMTDDIEIRTQTDYADDSGASFDIYITPKTERGKNTLDQISQMGLAEKFNDGRYFINDVNLEEATMSLNERGIKASGVYEPTAKGEQFESFRTAGQGPYGADYYGYDRLKEGFKSPKRPPMDDVDYDTIPSPTDKPEGFADGGLMTLRMGGMPAEMDLRKGGFVPLGKKERADDVPARLSKNEFVFTAKAVRNAGNGDVRKGAKRMYQVMNQLEARA
jgi:alkylhydroperoxidase/carboxymuconolactone decarboxylase family protein YurZ